MSPPARLAGREDLKSTTYEFFILAISVLSIVNMVLIIVLPAGSQSWWLVACIDAILTIIFLWDFAYRLRTARPRRTYLIKQRGIFDLLGCLPGLRIFRLFRILRAIRVLRRLGGPRVLRELRGALASGTLYLVVFLGMTVLEFVGLLVLYFEEDAEGANITTAGDALWWGYVTATTVGYGDRFPTTLGGRLVGIVMLTLGVALFATFSGFLANLFLSAGQREDARVAEAAAKDAASADGATHAEDLHAALARVERLHTEQNEALEKLRARVAALDPTA